jgi:hypothetical protein
VRADDQHRQLRRLRGERRDLKERRGVGQLPARCIG